MSEKKQKIPVGQGLSQNRRKAYASQATLRGAGRILIMTYGIFSVAATARALFQIMTKFHAAPAAYLLSAGAAAVYVMATVCLAIHGLKGAAFFAIGFEFIGVVAVGTVSILHPAVFPDETVWSVYGRGYGFLPLALPVCGLWWLKAAGRLQQSCR